MVVGQVVRRWDFNTQQSTKGFARVWHGNREGLCGEQKERVPQNFQVSSNTSRIACTLKDYSFFIFSN